MYVVFILDVAFGKEIADFEHVHMFNMLSCKYIYIQKYMFSVFRKLSSSEQNRVLNKITDYHETL